MERKEVYKLLDLEREYQNTRPPAKNDPRRAIGEWIIYMERHLDEAKRQIYLLDYDAALEQIRKVTALGIACMEHNETKARQF
jgi:hypothetical protein